MKRDSVSWTADSANYRLSYRFGSRGIMQGEVIRRPLAQADGTNRSVRRPPRETLGGLSQATIHPHCFDAGGMTVNNLFTVTGRIIPSYKKRPRRETRRSQLKASGRVVKHEPIEDKTTALIQGSGYRKSKFKSSGWVVKHDLLKTR